jgi:hypothetical protein
MSGHWVERTDDSLSEEVWSDPSGDSMIGMWRHVVGGKVKIFEILVLKEENGTVTLLLRHFDPKLIGWEKEREHPTTFHLTRLSGREATFETVEKEGTVRLTYRSPTEGELTGVLEKGQSKSEFRFLRKTEGAP